MKLTDFFPALSFSNRTVHKPSPFLRNILSSNIGLSLPLDFEYDINSKNQSVLIGLNRRAELESLCFMKYLMS